MHSGVPEEPVAPRKRLNVALAGALGLMIGVFEAFFLAFLEDEEKRGCGGAGELRCGVTDASAVPSCDGDRSMGEIRVRVELANAVDEALVPADS